MVVPAQHWGRHTTVSGHEGWVGGGRDGGSSSALGDWERHTTVSY